MTAIKEETRIYSLQNACCIKAGWRKRYQQSHSEKVSLPLCRNLPKESIHLKLFIPKFWLWHSTCFVAVTAKWKVLMLDSAIDCLELNYQSYKNINRVIACEAEIIYLVSGHTILIPVFPALPYSSKNQCDMSLLLLGIKIIKIGKRISRNAFLSFKIFKSLTNKLKTTDNT